MRSLLAFVIVAASALPALAGWQYKVISRTDVEAMAVKGEKNKFESGMNKLGTAGWELVAIEPSIPLGGVAQQPGQMIFKRVVAAPAVGQVSEDILEVMKLQNAKAADLVKVATAVFPKSEGITIVAVEKSNSVLVRGKPETLRRVGALIAELEKRGEKPAKK